MKPACLAPLAFILALVIIAACKGQPPKNMDDLHSPQDGNPAAGSEIPGDSLNFRKDAELKITSSQGDIVKGTFEVEIAATEEATMRGLMWREHMEKNQGMLFDPQGLANTSFWMKNTYLPLDIVFIGEDNRIIHIAENTKPFSEERISPGSIYRYVLEINAGICYERNIKIGDMVTWNAI